MSEQKFISSTVLSGTGKSLNATGKFPLIAKRVWSTYNDMYAFAGDTPGTCTPGLILTVVDDENPKLNGAYFVASCPNLDNPDIPVDVRKIGEGTGTLTIERPTFSELDNKSIVEAENVGQVIYITAAAGDNDSEEAKKYTPGAYIVSAVGVLSAIGTSVAGEDLSTTVATLYADVTTLKGDETKEGSVKKAIADLNISLYAKDADVVKLDGYVAYSDEDKNKLAGIEEGAQANIIEKVVFNGTEVLVDAQTKTVTLTTPNDIVRGLADGEKILALDTATGKLGTALSIEYFKDEADNNKPKLRLRGQENVQIGDAIDVSDFVKDGMLSSAELVTNPENKTGTYLKLTFNTDGDTDPLFVPVTDLIDVYTLGDGIIVDGKTIKAKVKDNDEFLEVTTEGIASKGITTAIGTAKNEIVGQTTDTKDSLTIYGVRKYADNAISDFKVKDVDTTASNGVNLTLTDSKVGVSVNTGDIATALLTPSEENNHTTSLLNSNTLKVAEDIKNGDNVLVAAGASIQTALTSVLTQVNTLHEQTITEISGTEQVVATVDQTNKLKVNLSLDLTKMINPNSALSVADGVITIDWNDV